MRTAHGFGGELLAAVALLAANADAILDFDESLVQLNVLRTRWTRPDF